MFDGRGEGGKRREGGGEAKDTHHLDSLCSVSLCLSLSLRLPLSFFFTFWSLFLKRLPLFFGLPSSSSLLFPCVLRRFFRARIFSFGSANDSERESLFDSLFFVGRRPFFFCGRKGGHFFGLPCLLHVPRVLSPLSLAESKSKAWASAARRRRRRTARRAPGSSTTLWCSARAASGRARVSPLSLSLAFPHFASPLHRSPTCPFFLPSPPNPVYLFLADPKDVQSRCSSFRTSSLRTTTRFVVFPPLSHVYLARSLCS
jgi:hypothetical protein